MKNKVIHFLATIGLVSAVVITVIILVKKDSIIGGLEEEPDYAAEFSYSVDEGSIVIDKYMGNRTSVVIPAEMEGMPVTVIGNFAFYECRKLVKVTLPDSLEGIGHAAFEGCTSLKEITIPEGVTDLGGNAFYRCRNLRSIVILGRVTGIYEDTFGYCKKLKSVSLPESVPEIGDAAA